MHNSPHKELNQRCCQLKGTDVYECHCKLGAKVNEEGGWHAALGGKAQLLLDVSLSQLLLIHVLGVCVYLPSSLPPTSLLYKFSHFRYKARCFMTNRWINRNTEKYTGR